MTQPPRNGQSAPADTESSARRQSGASGSGTPAGWGTTSTMDGTPYGRPGESPQGLGASSAAPRHDDAPTANVPLVQGSRAPGAPARTAGRPATAPAGPATKTASGGAGHAAARSSRARGPRRARLQLRHIDPWTVLKFSCVLSIALFFVWLIVIGVLFGVLDGAGIISKINNTVTTINGSGSNPPVTAGVVFGSAAIIGVVNIVLFIALSTIGSVVYNLCADLVGGIEVTLSER
ncbi:DUF3566 domain-containing protein [uncultured Jatrophihabitans sp.]|uniref:DUF3566 domain-containing protein n=1 Tax=uncultured Jatrophihabitans sp. TaxID=1610747 RepID=UPI0035C982D2